MGDLLGPGDRPLHAELAVGEHQLRAQCREQGASLNAHRLGHRDDQAVPLHRCDVGKADTGVAARRFNDH